MFARPLFARYVAIHTALFKPPFDVESGTQISKLVTYCPSSRSFASLAFSIERFLSTWLVAYIRSHSHHSSTNAYSQDSTNHIQRQYEPTWVPRADTSIPQRKPPRTDTIPITSDAGTCIVPSLAGISLVCIFRHGFSWQSILRQVLWHSIPIKRKKGQGLPRTKMIRLLEGP